MLIAKYVLKNNSCWHPEPKVHNPRPRSLTEAFGQQIPHKFIVVSHVEDVVDTGRHQLPPGCTRGNSSRSQRQRRCGLPGWPRRKTHQGPEGGERGEEKLDCVSAAGARMICCVCLCLCVCVFVCLLFTSSSMGPSASFSTSPWLLEGDVALLHLVIWRQKSCFLCREEKNKTTQIRLKNP